MTDLAEWLLTQIAEDEATARDSDAAPWRDHVHDLDVSGWFDPDRVLAECESKRRIIDWADAEALDPFGDQRMQLLRLLALPYADRDGYLEEWQP